MNNIRSPWFTEIVEVHGARYRVTLIRYDRPMAVEREVPRRDGSLKFVRHWGGQGGTWEYGPPPQGTISREAIDLARAAREAAREDRVP
jgi:hypothetical protein